MENQGDVLFPSKKDLRVFANPDLLGAALAQEVLEGICRSREQYILGLPTGATPLPLFENFIRQASGQSNKQKAAIAERLRILVMDDFVLFDRDENVAISHEWSAVGFIDKHLLIPLNAALNPHAVKKEHILYPRVGEVGRLKNEIIRVGGVDMQVLATDPYEGHVAQNFRGQPFVKSERNKVSKLSSDFLRHHPWASVFRGVTFDLSDFIEMIMANEHGRFAVVVTGALKAGVLIRLMQLEEYTTDLPLSFVWRVPERTSIYADQEIAESSG